MEVSNSTGQGTGYTVRGGGEVPGVSGPGKKAPRRSLASKSGKLRPKSYKKVPPPPGLWWKVEFHDEAGKPLASAEVRHPECLVILVQEGDGSYRVHCLRGEASSSASAA